MPFNIIGRPLANSPWTGAAAWMNVSDSFIKALNIDLIRGRAFNSQDTQASPPVLIINETMAKMFWPNADPLGQQVLIGKNIGPHFAEASREVVGIISDIHEDGLQTPPHPLMIIPQSQVTNGLTNLKLTTGPVIQLVRTEGEPSLSASAVIKHLHAADADLGIGRVRAMSDVIDDATSEQRFVMLLLGLLGSIALSLAVIGVYGLVSYAVQQRAREFGIRLALGSGRVNVMQIVALQGIRVGDMGIIAGLICAAALTKFLSSLLFGVRPLDLHLYCYSAVSVFVVTLLASSFASRIITRFQPSVTLRAE